MGVIKIALAAVDYGRPYWIRDITLEEVSAVPQKGDNLQEVVRNINPNEYPNGEEKDGYWYISVEIQ